MTEGLCNSNHHPEHPLRSLRLKPSPLSSSPPRGHRRARGQSKVYA